MKIKLTNVLQLPFTHNELSEEIQTVGSEGQPLYDRQYEQHQNGDIIELSVDAAENLVRSGQAVQVDDAGNEISNARGLDEG